MAVSIEQRLITPEGTPTGLATQLGDALGPICTCAPVVWPDGSEHSVREQYFWYGWLREVDGDAWAVSESTVADRFLPSPA